MLTILECAETSMIIVLRYFMKKGLKLPVVGTQEATSESSSRIN